MHFPAIYYVKERCQDGWFRGVNRAQKTGVFPGNYVTQLRALNEQSNGQSASGAGAIGLVGHSKRSTHGSNSGGATNITVLSKSGNMNPPDLPPRSSGSSSSSSSSASTSVWSKPIGQHVEALFGRKTQTNNLSLFCFSVECVEIGFCHTIQMREREKIYIQFELSLSLSLHSFNFISFCVHFSHSIFCVLIFIEFQLISFG